MAQDIDWQLVIHIVKLVGLAIVLVLLISLMVNLIRVYKENNE